MAQKEKVSELVRLGDSILKIHSGNVDETGGAVSRIRTIGYLQVRWNSLKLVMFVISSNHIHQLINNSILLYMRLITPQ